MPIYSGTAEVGKIYIGNAEVAKVFNNAGAEIWSAGFVIWDYGKSTDYTGGWTLRSSGNGSATLGDGNGAIYTYANNTANSYRAYFTTQKIPTSKYNYLTIKWAGRNGMGSYSTWGCARMALTTSTSIGWSNGYPTGNFVSGFQVSDNDTSLTVTTTTWNISSVTTDYYLCTLANSGVDTYGNYWAQNYLYQAILT